MNCDVDGTGVGGPDGSWNRKADLTEEKGILVLFLHLVIQRALDRVETTGLPCHQNENICLWKMEKTWYVVKTGAKLFC